MKESPWVLLVGSAVGCGDWLRAEGFRVEGAADLGGGIAAFRNENFALVILDLELPGCQGLDALCRFYEAAPGAPLLALAGPSKKPGLVVEAISRGAQDCLFKDNLSAAVLVQAARNAIARHQFQQSFRSDRTLLRALMQHIPDAIYFKDTASRFLMISEAHAKKFHLTNPAEAIGKTDRDFFSSAHAEQALADEREILRTGQPLVGIEEKETWPDGSVTWVSTTKMPLRDATGRIIGTFGISRDITLRKQMQDALAQRTRELERRNQQIAEELKMARELQMAMLPQEFPAFLNGSSSAGSALEFFSFYHPTGAVSGDFFTVTALSDSTVGVFICDVMGHDVRAALVTAMMRAQVQDLSVTTPDPGELLAKINQNLFSIFKQTGATMYATAFYLVADVARGELRYASAAHPDPLRVRRRAGAVEQLAGNGAPGRAKGPALGLFAAARFPTHCRELEAGDLIALYTDGLIEINSPDQRQFFTPELLAEAMRQRTQLPAADLLKGVISEIHEFAGQPEFEDDVCLIGMEVKRLGTNG